MDFLYTIFFICLIAYISIYLLSRNEGDRSFLDAYQKKEIIRKINIYNICDEELKKWADLRDLHSITEEEYQEKKENGQYVNNALENTSFIMKIMYDSNTTITDLGPGNLVEENKSCKDVFNKWHFCEYLDRSKVPKDKYGYPDILYFNIIVPQTKLRNWFELKNSNAITEQEYQNLKEELLKEGVNKCFIITKEIEMWSELKNLNAITEQEYQKLKVYLLQFQNKLII